MRFSVLHAEDEPLGLHIGLAALVDRTPLVDMEEKTYPYLDLVMHIEVAFCFLEISTYAFQQDSEEIVEVDTALEKTVGEDVALERTDLEEGDIPVENIALVGIVDAVVGILVEETVVVGILVEDMDTVADIDVEDILVEDTVVGNIVVVDNAVNGAVEVKNAVQEAVDVVSVEEILPCLDLGSFLSVALAVIDFVVAHHL